MKGTKSKQPVAAKAPVKNTTNTTASGQRNPATASKHILPKFFLGLKETKINLKTFLEFKLVYRQEFKGGICEEAPSVHEAL